MLIKFKSKAGGDVIMLGENGKEILALLGKNAEDSMGIFSAEQLPDAIAALNRAIAVDKALSGLSQSEPPTESSFDAGDTVRLSQRALPVLDLMERALREETYVTWGV